MSLDDRIDAKAPMFGCHSDLDKYREESRLCTYEPSADERACGGCVRQVKKASTNPVKEVMT